MESLELKHLLNEIGNSIHAMNTIVIALSIMPDENIQIPTGLNISWSPNSLKTSKLKSRNYSVKSALIYAAESLFEYLDSISKNIFWIFKDINFKGEEKKAFKVYNFLKKIPNINEENSILVELLCHWRNKIVHYNTSNAQLSSKKRDFLLSKKNIIFNNFHNFDVEVALKNFIESKVTLKDVSTLITVLIKCARLVDKHFFDGLSNVKSFTKIISKIIGNSEFNRIRKAESSKKRDRKIKTWIKMYYPYLSEEYQNKIFKEVNLY